jgi:hypothetical protein
MQFWAQIFLAGITGAIIALIGNVILKKLEYSHEYYKILIRKRLEAYEFLEKQIAILKQSVFSAKDGKTYHVMFSQGVKGCFELQSNLSLAFAFSMWISNSTLDIMSKINRVLLEEMIYLKEDSSSEELVDLGKKLYIKLAILRDELEESVIIDLRNIHNIKTFLNTKKKHGFSEITVHKHKE